MRRKYFIKQGVTNEGERLWIHIPGTPFTLPGAATSYERLPGMTEWVPRGDVESVSKSLDKGVPLDEISKSEASSGLLARLLKNTAVGGVGGVLAGRLYGGAEAMQPFIDVKKKGINVKTLKGLNKVPAAMKILPLIGAGAGGIYAHDKWKKDYIGRGERAKNIAKGLLAEKILQTSAIRDAEQRLWNVQANY